MEGLSDILVLLLIIAVSMIGSATKKRKKRLSSPQSDGPEEDFPETEPHVENNPKRKSSVILPPPPSVQMQKAIAPKEPPAFAPKKSVFTNVNTPDTENDIRQIIDQFDLRTAVIYKEILEPKFKEY